jgi:3-(3-hydroxy-phenyl)propionate hydroxylase
MVRFVDPEALEFWRSAVYHFHARVADEWQKGRVLLAGDAAHQMPPFLGQGLCAGFRDAVNLGWKLAMVLNGTAAPGLLATYALERKPHIRTLTAITVGLGKIIGETDPERAAARDKELREEMNSGNVETVRQNLIPPLDRGLVYCDPNGKKGEGAGTLAVQPLIEQASGAVLLDQLTGPNFAILSPAPLPEAWMNSRLAQDWLKRGGRVAAIGPAASALKESGHLFADWIAELKTYAVIVRPDRYVYGVAHDAEELDRLMQSLFKQLDPA